MQLAKHQITALQNLAASSAWQVARDTVFQELIHRLSDVNEKIDVPENITLTAGEAYAAKVAAASVLNDLVNHVDKFSGGGTKKDDVSFE